jgi:hypothetical protein
MVPVSLPVFALGVAGLGLDALSHCGEWQRTKKSGFSG